MKGVGSLVVLLGVVLSAAYAEEIKTDEGVLVLTKDTYEQAITENTFVLVEFCKSHQYICVLFSALSLTCHVLYNIQLEN